LNRRISIPAFKSRTYYLVASVVWAALAAQIYLITNRVGAPTLDLLEFDKRVPYLPSSLAAYVSIYLLMLWASLRITNLKFATLYLCFWVTLQLSAMVVYLVYPISYPRALFTDSVDPNSPWSSLIAMWHLLDGPANCLPSLHVSTALMALTAFSRRAGSPAKAVSKGVAGLIAMATIASTLTFKQHYVVDLIAGAAQAGFIYWLVFKSGLLEVR
jgi:membrane-associated phospholipid phosphatase